LLRPPPLQARSPGYEAGPLGHGFRSFCSRVSWLSETVRGRPVQVNRTDAMDSRSENFAPRPCCRCRHSARSRDRRTTAACDRRPPRHVRSGD
jgi:hypothetical protein